MSDLTELIKAERSAADLNGYYEGGNGTGADYNNAKAATDAAIASLSAQVVPQPDREALFQHAELVALFEPYAEQGVDGWSWIRVEEAATIVTGREEELLAALSPAPLTINRDVLAEWISVAIWGMSYRPADREPSPVLTCDVRWLDALRAADAVLAHLSAQTVEGEVEWEITDEQVAAAAKAYWLAPGRATAAEAMRAALEAARGVQS